MDALRWILLLLGAVVLIAIYVLGKRAEVRRTRHDDGRDEPRFGDEAGFQETDEPVAPEDEWEIIPVHRHEPVAPPLTAHDDAEPQEPQEPRVAPPREAQAVEPMREKPAADARSGGREPADTGRAPSDDFEDILIVHVVAGEVPLAGTALAEAFAELDLSLDERGVYIRADERGEAPLFGVVNMVKPGVFAVDALDDLETPGISLFLTLPGPEAPMRAFRSMSDCAKRLAERLGGRLEDETHSALSAQTLTHMEERVRLFIQHRARVAGPLR
ncbi:cell division protein ZipA [Acidihalobacter prosperus]|uniref:Cell division protein ZipA n=1 Tax=Acidihalobacter prosperus TaxID=160660 RepID=A0A1A6C8Z8_9GAMM|nr:cell division protein ZipA [Acidihalobacter prosperus]OBS11025.1 cell division protein ZipA [Acidihalobacter prosperus]